MTRGRKPSPTKLKLLKGARADRINPAEPEAPAGRPAKPEHLDDLAGDEWDRVVDLLDGMGVLARTDGAALALYCDTYSRWLRARAEVNRNGLVIETALGGTKANPAVAMVKDCVAAMHRLLAEFGLTPSSRSRLIGQAAGARDELAEFLAAPKGKNGVG